MRGVHVKVILIMAVLGWIAFQMDFSEPGKDAELYSGLADNLIEGRGYTDNIRNDEVLPSIGHPTLLVVLKTLGMDGTTAGRSVLLLVAVFAYLFFRTTRLFLPITLLMLWLIYELVPPNIEWGIEPTLALVATMFWLAITVHFRYRTRYSAAFVGLSVVSFILTRPVLLPLIYIALPTAILVLIFNKKIRSTLIFGPLTALLIMGTVWTTSQVKYDDGRLITGTYSAIPLYVAYNPYIDLEHVYWSTLWRSVPKEDSVAAFDQFRLGTGWKDRDGRIKAHVKEFISEHPGKALSGYWWRLKMYTTHAALYSYRVLFYIWLLVALWALWGARKWGFARIFERAVVAGLPAYLILLSAVFPFAGERYYMLPGLFLVYSLSYLITNLDFRVSNVQDQINAAE